jgi:phosphate:Na+ symporter
MNIFQVILQVLSLVGSMVLFLYGMKLMSESLQKIAGSKLRHILSRIASRRGFGILTGFLITSAIQSSSASTVMLVSFVNAGLVSFAESIALMFGANIGTTLTAWFISILGFGNQFSLYSVILPLLAFSLPLFFSYNSLNRAKAGFMIGFALLYVGIYFFRENVPAIDETSSMFEHLPLFENSFINSLLLIGLGIIITIIFQSSSATITLTMVLASQGWLSFGAALAMVLGENIGTTITANFAAIVANRSAKRTALAHFLFNLFGVLWMLPFLSFFTEKIAAFSATLVQNPENFSAIGISIFHSGFNIANTIVFLVFFVPFKNLCFRLLPTINGNEEMFSLKYIDLNLMSTSELSLLQARKEIAHMAKQTHSMFTIVPDLLVEKQEKKFARKFRKLQALEEAVDDMEIEIASYLTRISDNDLSRESERSIKAMYKVIDNVESVSDLCFKMGLTIRKKNEAAAWFTQELRNNIFKIFEAVSSSIESMAEKLEKGFKEEDFAEAAENFTNIRSIRNELQQSYLEEIKKERLPYKTGIYYNEILTLAEKIGEYVSKVFIAVNEPVKGTTGKHKSEKNKKDSLWTSI